MTGELRPVGVTKRQACIIAGVCRRTMDKWIKTGKVKYVRTVGGSVRIDPDSLFRKNAEEAGTKVQPSASRPSDPGAS
jgi:predicted site-specific integrase-resolvase